MSWAPHSMLATSLFAAAAALSVLAVHFDPWEQDDAAVAMVSTRSAARRVFPSLGDRDVAKATIEFQGPGGALVRLVPVPGGGHHLMEGDVLVGPADAEAVEGIWASLRMATTLRSVRPGSDVGSGQGGMIRVSFPDGSSTLELGREAAEGSGVYGVLQGDDDAPWVVEMEMRWLVEQPPRSWLARRVSPLEASEIVALSWGGELSLGRGEDGIWRVLVGPEPALLSNGAVDQRLDQLLSARMDPMLERQGISPESLRPWLSLTVGSGHTTTLVLGDECPGHSDRRIVDRGPGLLGCVPRELAVVWPIDERESGMLEARLIPHAYGRVLVIDQRKPGVRRLRRRTGGWLLEDGDGRSPVDEGEVFRWFDALAKLEVERLEPLSETPEGEVPPRPPFEPDVELVFEMDTNQVLAVRCQRTEREVLCARDDAPPRKVLGEVAIALSFDRDSFVDRTLTDIGPGEVRAVEIMAREGTEGRLSTARQSTHQDLGAWRLDAPQHPDGDAAVDEIRLEAIIAAASSIRAERWIDGDSPAPMRSISLDVASPGMGPRTLEIDVHALDGDGCSVRVDGGRLAAVSDGTCSALKSDLLFDDPLRAWLDGARSVQLGESDGGPLLRRERTRWVLSTGEALDSELKARLDGWRALRATKLVEGKPPGPALDSLTIRRDDASTLHVEVGRSWLGLAEADWYYAVERVALDGVGE